jgi:hypothetical protein
MSEVSAISSRMDWLGRISQNIVYSGKPFLEVWTFITLQKLLFQLFFNVISFSLYFGYENEICFYFLKRLLSKGKDNISFKSTFNFSAE